MITAQRTIGLVRGEIERGEASGRSEDKGRRGGCWGGGRRGAAEVIIRRRFPVDDDVLSGLARSSQSCRIGLWESVGGGLVSLTGDGNF